LKAKELSGLFFQPPQEASFFRPRTLIPRTSLSCNPIHINRFERISNRCAKLATWRWHDFWLACNSVVRERRHPERPAAGDRREHHKRLRAAGQSSIGRLTFKGRRTGRLAGADRGASAGPRCW